MIVINDCNKSILILSSVYYVMLIAAMAIQCNAFLEEL